LFGSTALGEDVRESDIDLCVISGDKKLELAKFEGLLSRKINIIFRKDFGKISKELKNNIINGIILKGHLKVF
jgi:predicted nucleotidyltransferase